LKTHWDVKSAYDIYQIYVNYGMKQIAAVLSRISANVQLPYDRVNFRILVAFEY